MGHWQKEANGGKSDMGENRRKWENSVQRAGKVLKTSSRRSSEGGTAPFYSRGTQIQASSRPGYRHLCLDPEKAGEPPLAGVMSMIRMMCSHKDR